MPTKGEATRQHLIETASLMFWQESYHATSMNDVCGAAQVNKATAYQYFPSKLDLALATIADNERRTVDYVFEGAFAEHDDPLDRLRAIFDRVYATHNDLADAGQPCPGCPFVNIGTELAGAEARIRDRVAQVFDKFRSYYVRIVREAKRNGSLDVPLSNRHVANLLVDLMNGAMTSAKIQNRPAVLLETKKNVVASFFHDRR